MKKRIISLLLVFALAFQLSGALAVTEKEWNAQCVNKTIHETMVYANAVDKENAASLPAGTYVLTHEYDVMSNRWKISYLDGESVKEGYVSGTDLTIAVATVVLEDGSIETIPETLKGQPEEIAAFLNDRYSDRIFEAKDGSILATDAVSDSATVEEETVGRRSSGAGCGNDSHSGGREYSVESHHLLCSNGSPGSRKCACCDGGSCRCTGTCCGCAGGCCADSHTGSDCTACRSV